MTSGLASRCDTATHSRPIPLPQRRSISDFIVQKCLFCSGGSGDHRRSGGILRQFGWFETMRPKKCRSHGVEPPVYGFFELVTNYFENTFCEAWSLAGDACDVRLLEAKPVQRLLDHITNCLKITLWKAWLLELNGNCLGILLRNKRK